MGAVAARLPRLEQLMSLANGLVQVRATTWGQTIKRLADRGNITPGELLGPPQTARLVVESEHCYNRPLVRDQFQQRDQRLPAHAEWVVLGHTARDVQQDDDVQL